MVKMNEKIDYCSIAAITVVTETTGQPGRSISTKHL